MKHNEKVTILIRVQNALNKRRKRRQVGQERGRREEKDPEKQKLHQALQLEGVQSWELVIWPLEQLRIKYEQSMRESRHLSQLESTTTITRKGGGDLRTHETAVPLGQGNSEPGWVNF